MFRRRFPQAARRPQAFRRRKSTRGISSMISTRTDSATPTRWRFVRRRSTDSSIRRLAGWILDHDIRSYQMIVRVFDGKPEGLSRDDVLDNITLYWLTNTAISSARLYWDTRHNLPAGGFFDARGVKLPVGVSAFAEEIYQAPKSWSEKAYVNLIHYNKFPKGTHFAAWEQSAIFVSEMRATFKSLRSS